MPVIKSAKKKLRQDLKRRLQNQKKEAIVRKLIKNATKHPTQKAVIAAVKATDKAAKVQILHKNKAARIKQALYKLLPLKKTKTATA